VIVLGDESGYTVGEAQQTKLAAMEAMWETEPAPASFNLIAIPNEAEMKNDFAIEIPWVMGLIGTRSLDKQIPGIKEIARRTANASFRHQAVTALEALRKNPEEAGAKDAFDAHKADLGFGLLLKKYVTDMRDVTPAIIDKAVADTVPRVAPMFWGFRLMVASAS
jgi:cytochrome d ubiquinol oxidase subunit I